MFNLRLLFVCKRPSHATPTIWSRGKTYWKCPDSPIVDRYITRAVKLSFISQFDFDLHPGHSFSSARNTGTGSRMPRSTRGGLIVRMHTARALERCRLRARRSAGACWLSARRTQPSALAARCILSVPSHDSSRPPHGLLHRGRLPAPHGAPEHHQPSSTHQPAPGCSRCGR